MRPNEIDAAAYRYVKIIQETWEKGNSMAYFALLKGVGMARLETRPGSGHNIIAVIDAIHAFQNANKRRNVREGYALAMNRMATLVFSQREAVDFIHVAAYELKYEREHPSGFKVDIAGLMDVFSGTLARNREKILKNGDDPSFAQWLNRQKLYLENNFGLTLRWEAPDPQ